MRAAFRSSGRVRAPTPRIWWENPSTEPGSSSRGRPVLARRPRTGAKSARERIAEPDGDRPTVRHLDFLHEGGVGAVLRREAVHGQRVADLESATVAAAQSRLAET